ncbi:hypothetical protein AKJ09_10276 [Labilithrix luteola]|uniref:Lipoprotein n=1 Tax=Labilithrix luteola TaxID=1391654 RepID=A0A0K1QD07_9BACT|nr:hypothetical protein [Labilithrix luteola]AKV03613.1 hypothetical protein AKJ09_10276 [Labilithrix luteola]
MKVRSLLVLLALATPSIAWGTACSKPPAPTDGATSAPNASATSSSVKAIAPVPMPASTTPAWLAVAEPTPLYGDLAHGVRIKRLQQPPNVSEIDVLLNRVATQPATAAGIRAAAKDLADNEKLGADPTWAGSGTSPGATILHHGGMALLVERTRRACANAKGNAEIGKAAAEIPTPPIVNSGGIDKAAVEQDRHVLLEAARDCGAKPD